MTNSFFERPILNSPYEYPRRHWELDEQGQPTQRLIETRRESKFITPIPKPKKRKGGASQTRMIFDEGRGLSTADEVVGRWIAGLASDSLLPHELAVVVRSDKELDRARSAVNVAGLPFTILDATVETRTGQGSIGTMHLAKGLEFRAVAAMACDDEVIPSQERVESVSDDSELEEVYNTERHLLYVACTRARDHLLVTAVAPGSEFLQDLTKSR